jgi:hypothetical protein
MFHSAMARFKRPMPGHGAIAVRKTSSAETVDEKSSEASFQQEDAGAATWPYVANNNIATVERRQDSVLDTMTEQAATIGSIGTLTPRPKRKDLQCSLEASGYFKQRLGTSCTTIGEVALDDDDEIGEMWLASKRERMAEDHARLNVYQQQLDQMCATLDDERAARKAQEFAAAQERAWEAQIRAARELRRAAEQRLAQMIVAEVVQMSASGRAYGDVAEIRRCAATKVEYQMVPDSYYPRFRPSS